MEDFYKQVYSQDVEPGLSHGWIQWKGTQVCMDTHCLCGFHGHIDGSYFVYYYQCPKCNRVYALGQNIKLILLNEEQVEEVKKLDPMVLYKDDEKA